MFKEPAMFQDREAAGRALVRRLTETPYMNEDPVIVCMPRGGVPLGRIIATEFDCDLDICLVRRIVSPTDPDQSIAAVTENGDIHLSNQASWGLSRKYIEEMRMKELADIRQRRLLYNTPAISLKRRTVILVDDGIASGATILAAVHSLRKENCAKIIVAAPICSYEAYGKLRKNHHKKLEDIIVLHIPPTFGCLAQFYMDFTPVTDITVMEALRENRLTVRTPKRRDTRERTSSLSSSSALSSSEEDFDENVEQKDGDSSSPNVDILGVSFNLLDLTTGKRRKATPKAGYRTLISFPEIQAALQNNKEDINQLLLPSVATTTVETLSGSMVEIVQQETAVTIIKAKSPSIGGSNNVLSSSIPAEEHQDVVEPLSTS